MTMAPDDPTSDIAAILRRRAEKLAAPVSAPGSAEEQLLGIAPFTVAGETYAFELESVREVAPLRELTPVPGAPPYIAGITHLRRRVLPLLDLRRFLGLPSPGITQLDRLIVMSQGDFHLGVLADALREIRFVDRAAMQAGGTHLNPDQLDRILLGVVVADERIAVLDAPRLLNEVLNREDKQARRAER